MPPKRFTSLHHKDLVMTTPRRVTHRPHDFNEKLLRYIMGSLNTIGEQLNKMIYGLAECNGAGVIGVLFFQKRLVK